MTREQDLERRLADWLESGPVVAPPDVVDGAIERTRGRTQRRLWSAWLLRVADRLGGDGGTRRLGLPVVIVLTLLTALAIAVPLTGGPGPAPSMEATVVRDVHGTAGVLDEASSAGLTEHRLLVDVADPRIRGEALQTIRIEDVPEAGLQRSVGVMRLENPWGAWEGSINGVRYPDGTEIECGWLAGEGAYAGFSYFHSTRDHPAEAERVLEGAIWPGEPPSMPDPSLLQADPLG